MGSGGKGGGTDWNQVAYGQANKHFAGGGNRDSLSAADPEYAPGGRYAEAADYAWSQQQQQQQQQQMMTDFMESMTSPSTAAPDSPEQQAYGRWADSGSKNENVDFATMQSQLGPAGEGQSYLFGPVLGRGADDTSVWHLADTPDFGSEMAGPGYEGRGYTASGLSFDDGRELRDAAMEDYDKALTSAESFVDSQISQEKTNSRLMGIDYVMDEDARNTRIGQALGDYGWGDSQQSDFDELLNTWGNYGYDQVIKPGAGGTPGQTSQSAAPIGGSNAPSGGNTALTALTDDEDTLDQDSLLGG